jgi:asparagine synthase (glutamine-hydrolysing)
MGALFGFSGPPDSLLLERMDNVLTHRGNYPTQKDVQRPGTICYRARFEPELENRLGAGIYSENQNRQTIALAGQLFSETPTEAVLPWLLQQYRSQGPDFLTGLRGAFVLVIRDGDTLVLARDGAGVRTIYYAFFNGRFRFAIEPKGIMADPGFPRRIRPASVAQYLTFSFVPGNHTMLEDLYELPAGHVVVFSPGQKTHPPAPRRYFFFENVPEKAKQDHNDADDMNWVERFSKTFAAAVEERLPRDEPVGVFLSGGIDSSIVASEVALRHRGPVKTYALHFGTKYPNELAFARAVAERCGTDHEEVFIHPKTFVPHLRQIIWYLDDPVGDPVTMPNFELSRHAAKEVRWVFNGEGGDPCFGGPKNVPMMLHHWYGGIKRGKQFRERMYLASYRRAYDDLSRLLTPDWQKEIDFNSHLIGVLKPFFQCRTPPDFLHKLIAINIRLKGAHLILPKVERMTGAWGLTPLAPLFDERLVKLSFEMPGRMKLSGGVEKIVLKRAFANRLPPEIIARPKSGMRVPVHFWFKGELKRYARKILGKKSIKNTGIFDPERVRHLLDYNTPEGRARCGLRLWMLITFEIWRRIVIEKEPI